MHFTSHYLSLSMMKLSEEETEDQREEEWPQRPEQLGELDSHRPLLVIQRKNYIILFVTEMLLIVYYFSEFQFLSHSLQFIEPRGYSVEYVNN